MEDPVSFPLLSEDDSCDIFLPSIDDRFNDLFDQLVNSNNHKKEDSDFQVPENIDSLFGITERSNGCDSPNAGARHTPRPPQPWRDGLWCLQRSAASSRQVNKMTAPSTAAVSGFELLSLEGLADTPSKAGRSQIPLALSTPPPTPVRTTKQKFITTPKTIRRREKTPNARSATWHSSKMMRQTQSHRYADWAPKVERISSQLALDDLQASLSSSRQTTELETPSMMAHEEDYNSYATPSQHNYSSQTYSIPVAEMHYQPRQFTAHPGYMSREPSQFLQGNPWTSPTIDYSVQQSTIVPVPSETYQDSSWWTTPETYHCSSDTIPLAAPKPQRTHSLVQSQPRHHHYEASSSNSSSSSTNMTGLGISFDEHQLTPLGSTTINPFYSANEDVSPRTSPTTPRRYIASSPSESPPVSHTHSLASSSHRSRVRRKASSTATTPKTPGAGGGVAFVNLGPGDSERILTGVAPSGSSKTKARREQEARDRKRKMNEMALRAVKQAGGDVKALKAVMA